MPTYADTRIRTADAPLLPHIILSSYSDFIVREIGLDGKVVRLAEEAVDSKKRKKGEGDAGEGPKADPAAVAAVAACLGGEQVRYSFVSVNVFCLYAVHVTVMRRVIAE